MSYELDNTQPEAATLREQLRITRQKNKALQTQLEESKQVLDHYRQAVDNSPNAIFSIDREGFITTWNPSCITIFKYDISILGSHFRLLLNDQAEADYLEKEVLHAGEIITLSNLDLTYKSRTGETREMVSRIYPVENGKGKVSGFVFANTDVTERNRIHRELELYRHHLEELVEERTSTLIQEVQHRKTAQKGLQASYDSLVTILDSMDFAIQVISLEQDEIIFINNRLNTLSAEGNKIKPDYQLFAPLATLSQVTEKGDSLAGQGDERSITHFDAVTNRWYLLQEREILWVDRSRVLLQVATDITERKQIDEERQRVEKLESLGVLAGGIAHDFNNQLTGIMGSLSLLKSRTDPANRNYGLLDNAVKAATRATSLTRQLLTFSKGGAPVRSIIAVEEVLREAVSFALTGSAVKTIIKIDSDLARTEADPGQLNQVFHNLALNAKQVMPDGGTLTVSAGTYSISNRKHLNDLPPGKYIRIDFSDTGPGIAPEISDKIFDPYFTTKKTGEGLGLATVHTIITKHNGKITVEPNTGTGSTFRILLPATKKVAPILSKKKTSRQISHGKILLMDDEEVIRQVGKAMLNHLGYTVDIAADGREALRHYTAAWESKKPYDVVILDLTIPGGMGGREAARRLLQINPKVKTIASSGYSDSPVMANSTDYGFSAVLQKPYKVEEVADTLQHLLAK